MNALTALDSALNEFEQLASEWCTLVRLLEAAELARVRVERGEWAPWWNARRIVLTRLARRWSLHLASKSTAACVTSLRSLQQSVVPSSRPAVTATSTNEGLIATLRQKAREPLSPLSAPLLGDTVEELPLMEADLDLDFTSAEVSGLCLDLQEVYRSYLSLLPPLIASQLPYLRFLEILEALPRSNELRALVVFRRLDGRCLPPECLDASALEAACQKLSPGCRNAYAGLLLDVLRYLVEFARRAMPWLSPAHWDRMRSTGRKIPSIVRTKREAEALNTPRPTKAILRIASASADQRPDHDSMPSSKHSTHVDTVNTPVDVWLGQELDQSVAPNLADIETLEQHLASLVTDDECGIFRASLLRTIRHVERQQVQTLTEWMFTNRVEQVTREDLATERSGQWFLRAGPPDADASNTTGIKINKSTAVTSKEETENFPGWLRRAFALHQVYRCEICDPVQTYYGPLAYERHFRSAVHVRGLHRLGVYYTADWDYIDTVADALRLKAHLAKLNDSGQVGIVAVEREADGAPMEASTGSSRT